MRALSECMSADKPGLNPNDKKKKKKKQGAIKYIVKKQSAIKYVVGLMKANFPVAPCK